MEGGDETRNGCNERNKTGELVDLPPRKKLIGVKWLFKPKRDVDGKIKKET